MKTDPASYSRLYLDMGLKVMPVHPPLCGEKQTGKTPAEWYPSLARWENRNEWPKRPAQDPKEFVGDGKINPNIGIILGPSRLVVIDFDADGVAQPWLKQHPDVADTLFVARSERMLDGRCHAYFRLAENQQPPAPINQSKTHGWELRSGNQYMVAPPSIHYTGGQYRFFKHGTWLDLDFDPTYPPKGAIEAFRQRIQPLVWDSAFLEGLPGYDIEEVFDTTEDAKELAQSNISKKDIEVARDALRHIDPAQGAERTNWIKIGMAAKSVHDSLRDDWMEFSRKAPNYGKCNGLTGEQECRRQWASFSPKRLTIGTLIHFAKQSGNWNPPRRKNSTDWKKFIRFQLTDTGNAMRFVEAYKDRLRFVSESRTWLVWNSKKWETDENEALVLGLTKGIANSIRQEASALDLSDGVQKQAHDQLLRWADTSESESKRRAMFQLAQAETEIAIRQDQLDSNPLLLNLQNGIYNLKTDSFGPHDPNHLQTRIADVEFNLDADCPLWRSTVEFTRPGNVDEISYIARILAYSMTGSTSEEALFIFYGGGQNGKGTILDTVHRLLGDYSKTANASTFVSGSSGSQSETNFVLAGLQGVRFVHTSETDDEHLLSEALVKRITGRDKIPARRLYGNYFEFYPRFKLFIDCNHKPVIRNMDKGIWRRIHLIPFTVQIPDDSIDRNLKEKLTAEHSGILNWLIAAYRDYQRQGLKPPESILAAKAEYKGDNDFIGRFILEVTEPSPDNHELKSDVYRAYSVWAKQNGETEMKKPKFLRRLNERFATSHVGSSSSVAYKGFRIIWDAIPSSTSFPMG